jgi:hypothetical protein
MNQVSVQSSEKTQKGMIQRRTFLQVDILQIQPGQTLIDCFLDVFDGTIHLRGNEKFLSRNTRLFDGLSNIFFRFVGFRGVDVAYSKADGSLYSIN